MSLNLTQISSDNFTRANESPLSQGGNWAVPIGAYSAEYLQIVSDLCQEANFSGENGINYYTGVSTPNDQYASATLAALSGSGTGGIFVGARSAGPVSNQFYGTSYIVEIYNNNPNLGSSSYGVMLLYSYVAGSATFLTSSDGFKVNIGDVYALAVIGTTVYVLQNGSVLTSITDTTISSGQTLLAIESTSSQSGVQVSNFSMGSASTTTYSISGNAGVASATVSWSGTSTGSTTCDGSGNYTISGLSNGNYMITPSLAGYTFSPTSSSQTVNNANITGVNFTATAGSGAWSPVDCRVKKPNFATYRVVNGAQLDDVQTSSNPIIPPDDSRRAGAPDACSTYPQNSRVNPLGI